jgi:hypothetical protein
MTTLREMILLSANNIGVGASESFTVEDLVVACWRKFPESFALKGHTEHADSNKVLAKLSGTEGVRALGWIEHDDQGRLRLTRKGRTIVAQLEAGRGSSDPTPEEVREVFEQVKTVSGTAKALGRSKSGTRDMLKRHGLQSRIAPTPSTQEKHATPGIGPLTAAEIARVEALAKHPSPKKFLRGSPLSVADALAFWGVKSSDDSEKMRGKVAEVGAFLERIIAAFAEGSQCPPSPPVSVCYSLLNMHRVMVGKFGGACG